MSLKEVTITGPNNVKAKVTGQEELLVRLNSIAPNTIATEATLQAVLNTLQAFTEYEAKFVIDANNEIFLEVRVWNEDTSTWASAPTYYRVGENTPASPAPVAPISYLDASSVLQSITHAEDSPHVSGDKGVFALTVRNDANAAMTSANGDYSPIAVNDKGAVAIQDGGNSITVDGGTGVQRTPTFARPTGSNGTVAAGAFSVSFASVGTANAIVGGITLKPGETLNFDAGAINNTLAAITYDTSTNAGAELIIIKLT